MNVVLPLGRTLNFTSLRTFATTTPMFYPRLRSNGTPQQRVLPPSLLPPAASYTSEHIEELKKNFTPEQLSALLIGEQAIDPEDFKQRAERRSGDPFALGYLDDLTKLDPLLDFPEHMNRTGKDGFKAWLQPLPKINDPKLCFKDEDQEGDTLRALSQHTGMPVTDLKNIRCRTMVVHSVTNQTRMGKIRKMYVLAVAGNGNGLLGIGEGKSAESEDAIRQASYMAIRNMEPIPRYEKRTIYGDVEVKQGAVEMKIFTRPPGFGVRCSQYIFEMCRCLGIQDLSARVTRSRNPMNVIKTFMKALKSQKLPETIARGRGKKLVDVRKVYYGGNTSG